MQRKHGELIPIGEVFSDLGGPVKAIREASPQARHHFNPTRSVMAMILKVRGLNVIIGDLMVAWPRNGTKLSRLPPLLAGFLVDPQVLHKKLVDIFGDGGPYVILPNPAVGPRASFDPSLSPALLTRSVI